VAQAHGWMASTTPLRLPWITYGESGTCRAQRQNLAEFAGRGFRYKAIGPRRTVMDLNTIVRQLANVTADLTPSRQTTAYDLDRARVCSFFSAERFPLSCARATTVLELEHFVQ